MKRIPHQRFRNSGTIAAILPALVLAACAGDSDLAQVTNLLFHYATGSNEKVTRDRAAAVPFATMGLEFGSTPQVLFILGAAREDQLEWYSGDQAFLATSHGRVVRTAGFPYDLGGFHALPANSINAGPAAGANPAPRLFALDYPDLGVFGATAQCSSRNAGDATVEILGTRISTIHVIEHCTVPALKWTFDNEFWQDRMSGYVWRSSQHIHPKSPPIVLEVLRPEQSGPG